MNNLKKDINLIKGLIIAVLILSLFSFFNGCSNSNNIKDNKEEINTVNEHVDSTFYSKKEMDLIIEIQAYKLSKRMLYDNNAIVRTKIRPDDRMNQYDVEINELQKQLKILRRNHE